MEESLRTIINAVRSVNDCKALESLASLAAELIIAIADKKAENPEHRLALFPRPAEREYEFYIKQTVAHWNSTEIRIADDKKYYDALSQKERHILDNILVFFLVGDGSIVQNLALRFILENPDMKEIMFFVAQLDIEMVHADVYSLALIHLIQDEAKIRELTKNINENECVKAKVKFMEKYTVSGRPSYIRKTAYGCSEGIFFATLFSYIFQYRVNGTFKEFVHANELISKDETLHRDRLADLIATEIAHSDNPTEMIAEIVAIVMEAIEVEYVFTDYILPEPVNGITNENMKKFVRVVADSFLMEVGIPPRFNEKNPFPWMNEIALPSKKNFYEVKVGDYTKGSVSRALASNKGEKIGDDAFTDLSNEVF